jgi:hypothetical protein
LRDDERSRNAFRLPESLWTPLHPHAIRSDWRRMYRSDLGGGGCRGDDPETCVCNGRNRPPTGPPPTRRVIFMNNCSDIHQLVGRAAESRSQPPPLCRNSHLFDVHYYQPPVRRNALHVRQALPPNITVLQHHSICSPASGLSTVGSCRDQCRTRPIDRQFSVVLASPDGAASMTDRAALCTFGASQGSRTPAPSPPPR